jgi:gliding motility-associated-like protein
MCGLLGYSQFVVVSEYFNTVNPTDEWTELLVVQDDVNMTNWTLRDNAATQSGTPDGWNPPITFINPATDPNFWNHMRAGTIIVIWHRQLDGAQVAHATDLIKADGFIQLQAQDANYFSGGVFGTPTTWNGNTLNLAATGDIVQIRDAGGVHVHALAHRANPGADWNALPPPKLNHQAGLTNNWSVFVVPGLDVTQYGTPPQNGTTFTKSNVSTGGYPALDISRGRPNTYTGFIYPAGNCTYWQTLRQPVWNAPVATAVSQLANTEVLLSWNTAIEPYSADNTGGYIILRNTINSFSSAPTDGHTYATGDVLGGATVVGHSLTTTFTDTYTIACGGSVFYRVYAYRYSVDEMNGQDFNLARGRAYNELDFAAVSITVPLTPTPQTVTGNNTYCSGATPAGTQINLGNSESGVSYQLYRDCPAPNTIVGTAISGTGSSTSFGYQTIVPPPNPCTFSVIGKFDLYPACSTNMSNTLSVTEFPSPTFTVDSTHGPTTCGGTDGYIILNGLPVSTSFLVAYTKNSTTITPIPLSSDPSGSLQITGLSAGFYYGINVTSPDGCVSALKTATLFDPALPPAPTIVASDNPVCLGFPTTLSSPDCSGTLTWTPVIAGPPYTITPGASITYTATCTVNNCESFSSAPLTIVVNPAPSIGNVTPTPATCGIDNGTISISASGGTGALEYSIDGGVTWQASSLFSLLPAGSYNIIVRDASLCQIVYPLNPVVIGTTGGASVDNVTPTDEMCGNSNGTITITATGGTPPLQYSIDGGITYQTANIFNNLPAGNYTVVVNDVNNCSTPYPANPVVINNTAGASITSVTPTDATCGASNGSIVVISSGGAPPYQYSNDGGTTWQVSNAFNGLGVGNYSIVVKDNNNCQTSYASNPVVISSNGGANITNITHVDASCGNSNGSISITHSGGVAPFRYTKDGGVTWQNTSTFSNLGPGTFTIIVEDANGCQTSSVPTTIVDQPSPVITTLTPTDATNGLSNGSLASTATGTIPLTYSIDGGANWQNNGNFSGLSPNNYILQVKDANGCITTSPFSIVDNTSATVTLTADTSSACPGDRITINVVGTGVTNIQGVNICITYDPTLAVVMSVPYVAPEFQGPPITDTSIPGEIYFYDNITPLINIADGDILFSIQFKGLKSGTSLFDWDNFKPGICGITDINGNNLVVDFEPGMLDFYPMPPATIIGPADACEGNPVMLTALGDTLTHVWTLPDGSKITAQDYDIPSVSISDAGSYYLLSTTTTFQCTDTASLLLNVHPAPQVKLANGDLLCMESVAELTPGSGFSSYTWNDGTTLPSLPVFGEGTYWVQVTDVYGCEGSDTVSLVICPAAFFVISAFSPNSDGLNDFFKAKYSDIDPLENFKLLIYNRWGQLLFETTNINEGWDGNYNGEPCPTGAYAYVIQFDKPTGKTFTQKSPFRGMVTLIR